MRLRIQWPERSGPERSGWHLPATVGLGVGVLLSLWACGQDPSSPPAPPLPPPAVSPQPSTSATAAQGMVSIPEPDLRASVAEVQKQVQDQQAKLADLRARGAEPKALAQGYADLGLVYLTYDFLDAADACLRNARHLSPDDFRWVYLLGYLSKLRGFLPAARELLEAALQLEPKYLPAVLRLAQVQLESGEPQAAQALFARALELDAQSAAAFEGLGKVAEAQGDFKTAAAHLERAVQLQPQATGLNYALGQVYRRLGDLDRARALLEKSGEVAVRIEDPLLNPVGGLAVSAQFYFMQAGEAMEVEDYPTAAAAYREVLALEPGNFKAYKGLSYSLEKLGDTAGALTELGRALQLGTTGNPQEDRRERAEILRIQGGLLALAGQDGPAIAAWTRALELNPQEENARLKLANALARQRHFAEAISHYDLLVKAHPDAAEILIKRATALVNLKRADEARHDFERAIALEPDNPEPRQRFAEALEFWGDPAAAREARQQAASLVAPGLAQAQTLADTGRRQARQGEFEAALSSYRAALAQAPDQQGIRYEFAALLGHRGQFAAALAEFRRVIEAEPRHQAARHGEITTLLLSQRYGEARVRLNEALRLFPRDFALAHTQARLMASVPDVRVRDGQFALAVAQKLHEAKPDDLRVRETLAMALAAADRFDEALAVQRPLLEAASRQGLSELLPALRRELAAYESRQPWTFTRPEELIAVTLAAAGG